MANDTNSGDGKRLAAVLSAVAVVAVAGATIGVGMMTVPDTAGASTQIEGFSIPDASTESEQVNDVWIEFGGATVSWTDTPAPVEEVRIVVSIEGPDGEMHEAQSWNCNHEDPVDTCGFNRSTEGSTYFDYVEVGMAHDGGWTSDQLTPPPGEEKTYTATVQADVEVIWEGGSMTETVSDGATITVTNPSEPANPSVTIGFGTAEVVFDA